LASEWWYCPVFERDIEISDCFECSMAAEGWGPSSTRIEMEEANADFMEICLECEHHPLME